MKIQFERSGGFTGIPVFAEIESQTLDDEEAQHLQELLDTAHFFDLPAQPPTSPPPGADQFQYKITVEDAGQRHTVQTTDSSATADLRPLLQHLTLMARRR